MVSEGERKNTVEERRTVGESMLYRKSVAEVLIKQIEICAGEQSVRNQTAEKEKVLQPMNTSYFSRMEGTVHQRLLQRLQIGYFETMTEPTQRGHFLGSYKHFLTKKQRVWRNPHSLHLKCMWWY